MKPFTVLDCLLIAAGILLFFIGLWGGAWALTHFPNQPEYGFASFFSGFIFCIGGIALIMSNIVKNIK